MAPQFGPGSQNGPQACFEDGQFPPCDASNGDTLNNASSGAPLNVPMLALGLALALFLLVCLAVCLCTYRNARARNRATRNLIPQEMEPGEYVGLGLGLQHQAPVIITKDEDKEAKTEDQPPPAYSPKPSTSPRKWRQQSSGLTLSAGPSTPNPLLSLTPSPALATPVSPALSSYTHSPALSQGENEEVGLLSGRRALTQPPPTYVR